MADDKLFEQRLENFNAVDFIDEKTALTLATVAETLDILKDLQDNKTVLIVAHGNSLRSIVMYIEKISEEDIPNYEIPTGIPIVYTFDANMNIIEKKEL